MKSTKLEVFPGKTGTLRKMKMEKVNNYQEMMDAIDDDISATLYGNNSVTLTTLLMSTSLTQQDLYQ